MAASNLEPVARAICERIARRPLADGSRMPEAEVRAWVDRHWECVASDLAAGLIDEEGRSMPIWTLERSFEWWQLWRRGG